MCVCCSRKSKITDTHPKSFASIHFPSIVTHANTHTRTSINTKMPRPTNDKIILISAQPEQERFEVSTDVAKCVLFVIVHQNVGSGENFFLSKKKRADRRISLGTISLSLNVSRKNGFDRLVKHAPIFSRDTDRFSFFFYAQTACRKPWKPPSVVRKNLSKKLSLLVLIFLLVFFSKVASFWRDFLTQRFDSFCEHTTRERKSKLYTTTNLFFLSRVI